MIVASILVALYLIIGFIIVSRGFGNMSGNGWSVKEFLYYFPNNYWGAGLWLFVSIIWLPLLIWRGVE